MNKNDLVEQVIRPFFKKVAAQSFITKDIPKIYDEDIRIKVRFGSGRFLDIPWFGFMGGGYTNQRGIYVPITFYRNHGVAFLTYAESYKYPSPIHWGDLPHEHVETYFAQRGIELKKTTEWKYNNKCYYGVYQVDENGIMAEEEMLRMAEDIEHVLVEYRIAIGIAK